MNTKRVIFVLAMFFVALVLVVSGCVPSAEVITSTAPSVTNIVAVVQSSPTVTASVTLIPSATATPTIAVVQSSPTVTASVTLIPSATATPEPVLYCADKIPNCYFLGSEFARIFAFMTLPCFENGGKCYPPVEECATLPPGVVHVPVNDFAVAWESEVTGNPDYESLLDSKLYNSAKQYCFVDEGIGRSIRDAGNAGFTTNRACLDNEKVPCDIALVFYKVDYDACPPCLAFLTKKNFIVTAAGATDPVILEIELGKAMNGEAVRNPSVFEFSSVLVSSAVGFDNKNPPLGIHLSLNQ